jgi:hypothetical protein
MMDEVWDNPGNWTAGVPNEMTGAIIPNVSKAPFPVIYGAAATGFLTIFPGASLTLGCVFSGPCGDLTVHGVFDNNGNFYIDSENGFGYAGSFINHNPLASTGGTGMFYFTRNMLCTGITADQFGPGANFGWHYLAAPISDPVTPLNGFSTHNLFDYYVNAWDETALAPALPWVHVEGVTPDCAGPGPDLPLGPMEAWSINYALDYSCDPPYTATGLDLEFMGDFVDVHDGPYQLPATFAGDHAYQGWNFFGNPYPSGLDVDAITWDPNAVQTLYFYDGCFGDYVEWTAGAPGFGTTLSSVMGLGQGFFVEYTAPGFFDLSGTFGPGGERQHGADFFWKSEVTDLLKLQASGAEKSDDLIIRFSEEATAEMDKQGDARKLISQAEDLPQIYTTNGDLKFAINSLPATPAVPMSFTSVTSGTYTIEAVETSEFENVVLEDLVLGIQTNLLEDSYTFEYNAGDDDARFIVHFTPLGMGDNFADLVNIWSSAANIYVQTPEVTGEIVVFNMMGQEVVRTDIQPGLNTIPMHDVNTYYVVKVLTSENAVTGKVFIK